MPNDLIASSQLVLEIKNIRPISVDDFGDLFIKMARDYRTYTRGRTLVVAKIDSGSVHAILRDAIDFAAPYAKDAVEIAKGGKAIYDFAKMLKGLFSRADANPGSVHQLKGRAAIGIKTLRAAAKVAVETGSEIEIKNETSNEVTTIRVTPLSASRLREVEIAPAQRGQFAGNTTSLLDTSLSKYVHSPELLKSVRDLTFFEGQGEADIATLVSTIASTLRKLGLDYMIGELANQLEARGQLVAARLLKAETERPSRGRERPPSI